MGVMGCARVGCGSIMCDTYIDSVGYICQECKGEFEKYLEENNLNPETEGQISKELEKFMEIPRDYFVEGEKMSVTDFFNKRSR